MSVTKTRWDWDHNFGLGIFVSPHLEYLTPINLANSLQIYSAGGGTVTASYLGLVIGPAPSNYTQKGH